MARVFFFCIFHALSFEFNFFSYRRFPLRRTVPFVTAHLKIFHCTHHPVIPETDFYFTLCSTLSALSERTSK